MNEMLILIFTNNFLYFIIFVHSFLLCESFYLSSLHPFLRFYTFFILWILQLFLFLGFIILFYAFIKDFMIRNSIIL